MMPQMTGYELCKEIRKESEVPVIMISAKDEEIDRVLGVYGIVKVHKVAAKNAELL